jgi:sulfofructose kinase
VGRVLAVGWACVDLRFHVATWPPEGSRTPVTAYREAVGGPAAVASLAVARLGGEAALLSRRGEDPWGGWLVAELAALGVRARFAVGEKTPVSAVVVVPDGERYIFPYRGQLGTALPEGWSEEVDGAAVVLADARWPEAAEEAFVRARQAGKPRVMDLDSAAADALHLARLATHVVASEEAERALGGLEALEALFPGAFVAVTRGARGVAWPGGHVEALPLEPKDTTGAGDVFHGAFAWALARGWGEVGALRVANAVAGLYVARGQVPSWTEVERWMHG